jgi:ferredoxin, 2Fe-2S
MVEISIENMDGLTLKTHTMRPLLFLLQEHHIDWMHACGGKGRCTTCKFRVVRGSGNLSPLTTPEVQYRLRGELQQDERLACQARITGNVAISVPAQNKLPHLRYSDE